MPFMRTFPPLSCPIGMLFIEECVVFLVNKRTLEALSAELAQEEYTSQIDGVVPFL